MKRFLDFILFTSLFIASCAVMMVYHAAKELHLETIQTSFYYFVFFATLTTYNFHWYFTKTSIFDNHRIEWSLRNQTIHLVIFILGLLLSISQLIVLSKFFLSISISVILAFLYTAPKLPTKLFQNLRIITSGKTLYLSLTWVYVTTILPLVVGQESIHEINIYFILYRFFYIYPICILFDYRDRESDQTQGINTFLNYFNERAVNAVFFFSNVLCIFFTTLYLLKTPFYLKDISLYIPSITLLLIFRSSKNWKSDYFYYFFLDGLMALPFISVL